MASDPEVIFRRIVYRRHNHNRFNTAVRCCKRRKNPGRNQNMMNDIAVSVIIPLYNRGEYISRALNSVLQQTFQNFEIIVVDGHSGDDGPSIVKNIEDNRIIFFEQEGKGLALARNQGVNRARTDFIAFLDADDEWSPEHLASLIRLREKFPNAGIYATTYKRIEPGNVVKIPKFRAIPPPTWEGLIPNYFLAGTLGATPIIPTSVGIPKDVFIGVGGSTPGVQWGEDDDLWIRIVMKYPVAYSWKGEALWHCDADNRIGNSIPDLPLLTREPVVERGLVALSNHTVSPEDAPFLKEYIAKFELNRALWNLKTGNAKNARTILKECKTKRFILRKIRLLIFSSIPVPVFMLFWKTIRLLRHHLFRKDYSHDPWLK